MNSTFPSLSLNSLILDLLLQLAAFLILLLGAFKSSLCFFFLYWSTKIPPIIVTQEYLKHFFLWNGQWCCKSPQISPFLTYTQKREPESLAYVSRATQWQQGGEASSQVCAICPEKSPTAFLLIGIHFKLHCYFLYPRTSHMWSTE